MRCVNDDLATCCGKCNKMKVVAVIPVYGRGPLVKHTIERLYKKNEVHKVICVGNVEDDKKVCIEAGAEWVNHLNTPLGAKWNAGFMAAEKHNPDACLFVGSSDWLSDNWLPQMLPLMRNCDLIGTPGCHFLHIGNEFKLCYWPGYKGVREGESIGIGRLISRRVLDKLQFKPFNDMLNGSLDYSMIERCKQHAANIQLVDNSKIKSVSISTDIWPNKHNFLDHYNGLLKSDKINTVQSWIEENFPEANLVFHAS